MHTHHYPAVMEALENTGSRLEEHLHPEEARWGAQGSIGQMLQQAVWERDR